jgi:hypothetical protein
MESIARYLDLTLEPRKLPGLEARFSGPRAKKGAKAAKGKVQAGDGTSAAKVKDRLRDRKNIGKRRKPTSAAADTTAPSPWGTSRRRPPSP